MKDPQLTALRRQLKADAPVLPKQPVAAPAPVEVPVLSDDALFAEATRGARRLQADAPPARPVRPRKPDALTLQRRAHAEGGDERAAVALSDTVALLQGVAPEAYLAFKRVGVQERQFEQLKAGKLPWRHAVDLHGCTLDQAREAILQLFDEAQREQITVVKVVHGKGHVNGQALLKTAVNGWLRQLTPVLAFCSADARNGGTGAVLVLLRRPRPAETGDRMPPV